MTDHLYKVVFTGQFRDSFSSEEVKHNLSKNLRLPKSTVERILVGNKLVIKKNIDYEKGKKYQRVFKKSGLKCDLITMDESNNPHQPSASVLSQKMTCPHCGFEQELSGECSKCGIVFRKYIKEENDGDDIESAISAQKKESNDEELEQEDLEEEDLEEELTIHDLFDLQDLSQRIKKREVLILARRLLFARLRPTMEIGKRIFLAILQTAFSVGLVLAMYILILYTINGFWGIYTSTQVGKFYAHEILDSSHFFYEIIEYDVVSFSFSTTVISLLTCLLIAAIGKLLGLNLYFYYSRGVITRLILWAVPLTFLSAYAIQGFFEFENFLTAIAGAFIPTFCLHPACFRFVENSFPTLFDIVGNTSWLLSFLFDLFRRLISKVLPPDKGKTEEEIDPSEIIEETETQVKIS